MARSSHLALAMLAVAALALVLSAAPADAQDQVVALPAPALPPPTPHRRPHASPAADPPRIGASGSAGPVSRPRALQPLRAPACAPRVRVCSALPCVVAQSRGPAAEPVRGSSPGGARAAAAGRRRLNRAGCARCGAAVPWLTAAAPAHRQTMPQQDTPSSRLEEFTTTRNEAEKLKAKWAAEKKKEVRAAGDRVLCAWRLGVPHAAHSCCSPFLCALFGAHAETMGEAIFVTCSTHTSPPLEIVL